MDARETIYHNIVEGIPGSKKLSGDSYFVQCPMPHHDDNTPSCGINLADDSDVPLGHFYCFGCGAKGGWNTIAENLGLEKIKDWQLNIRGKTTKRKKNLKHTSEDSRMESAMETGEMIPWPKDMYWRGYSGDIITKLNGMFYNDALTDEMMLFFPIQVNNRFKGGVRAYLEKQANGLNYITTKGKWVKDSGLLGYEYTKRVVRKNGYRSVVLVEGPRDLLRLLVNRIPALAILGSHNFTEKKLYRVMTLSGKLDKIYVMPDNDSGGNKMYETVRKVAEGHIDIKRLKIPRERNEKGELIKEDPDSCGDDIIRQVRKLVVKDKSK